MSKANPKAWFTSPIAKISYRKVGRWDTQNQRFRPFFPTWKEAHDWMLATAQTRFDRAQRELASARRFLDKIKTMKEPTA